MTGPEQVRVRAGRSVAEVTEQLTRIRAAALQAADDSLEVAYAAGAEAMLDWLTLRRVELPLAGPGVRAWLRANKGA